MIDEQLEASTETLTEQLADDTVTKQESSQDKSFVLENRVKQLEQELANSKEQYVRFQAEFANTLRRKDQEREQALKFAHIDFLKEFILVLDSVESGLLTLQQSTASLDQMLEGLTMMGQQLHQLLDKFGLTLIEPAVGQLFDPVTSEAMSMQPTTDYPHNSVLLVVQKGYTLNGRLLRPARVIVANNTN
jgi:molecular chaperone GrpE